MSDVKCNGLKQQKSMSSVDKFDFISIVDDVFDDCKSEIEMRSRRKEMKDSIDQCFELKLNFKKTMGEFSK